MHESQKIKFDNTFVIKITLKKVRTKTIFKSTNIGQGVGKQAVL